MQRQAALIGREGALLAAVQEILAASQALIAQRHGEREGAARPAPARETGR